MWVTAVRSSIQYPQLRMDDANDQLDLFDRPNGDQILRVAFVEPPDREVLGGSQTSTNSVVKACAERVADHGWIFNHKLFSEYIVSLNELDGAWSNGSPDPDLVVAIHAETDWYSGMRTGQAISASIPILIISPNRYGVRTPQIQETRAPRVKYVKCISIEQVAGLTADWCVEQAIQTLGFTSHEIQVTRETRDRQFCHRVWSTLDEVKRRSIANMIGIGCDELQSSLRDSAAFVQLGPARCILVMELQLHAGNVTPVRRDLLTTGLDEAERTAFANVVVQRKMTDRQAALLLERGIKRKLQIETNDNPELVVSRGSLDTEQAWRNIARDIH